MERNGVWHPFRRLALPTNRFVCATKSSVRKIMQMKLFGKEKGGGQGLSAKSSPLMFEETLKAFFCFHTLPLNGYESHAYKTHSKLLASGKSNDKAHYIYLC